MVVLPLDLDLSALHVLTVLVMSCHLLLGVSPLLLRGHSARLLVAMVLDLFLTLAHARLLPDVLAVNFHLLLFVLPLRLPGGHSMGFALDLFQLLVPDVTLLLLDVLVVYFRLCILLLRLPVAKYLIRQQMEVSLFDPVAVSVLLEFAAERLQQLVGRLDFLE